MRSILKLTILSILLTCIFSLLALPAFARDTVSLGYYHSAAIKNDGSLWMWGANYYGQLGNGTGTGKSDPMKIMDDVSQVSLQIYYSAAIKNDGSLWMWGHNGWGQLGNGTTLNSSTPVKIMDDVSQVSLGIEHCAALKNDGTLWIWGRNNEGQLGNGTMGVYLNESTPIKIMDNVSQISLGGAHSGALKNDGSLWMWGHNGWGQLGNGTTLSASTPVKVMDDVSQISLGNVHSAALKNDGSLWMWGSNCFGDLGDGTDINQNVPIKVMDDVFQVSLGNEHSAVIKNDGSLWTWGANSDGQLGDGTYTFENRMPTKIMNKASQVYLGDFHSAALKSDGSLWMWGRNNEGQLGNGTIEKSNVPIKVLDNVLGSSNSNKPDFPSSEETLEMTFQILDVENNNPVSGAQLSYTYLSLDPNFKTNFRADNQGFITAIFPKSFETSQVSDFNITAEEYHFKSYNLAEKIKNKTFFKDKLNVIYLEKDSTPGENYRGNELILDQDVWQKNNGYKCDFKNFYELNSEDHLKLVSKLTSTELDRAWQSYKHKNGHCYGLSTIVSLNKAGKLKDSRINSYSNLFSVPFNDDTKSLIDIYQMSQFSSRYDSYIDDFMDNSDYFTTNIESDGTVSLYPFPQNILEDLRDKVINVKSKNAIPPVVIYQEKTGRHAVVAYAYEYKKNGFYSSATKKTYDNCIYVYDPNCHNGLFYSTNDYAYSYKPEYNIYFKGSGTEFDWEIPQYVDEGLCWGGSGSIICILDTYQKIDLLNQLPTLNSLSISNESIENYVLVNRESSDFTLTVNGKKWTVYPRENKIKGNAILRYWNEGSGDDTQMFIKIPYNNASYSIKPLDFNSNGLKVSVKSNSVLNTVDLNNTTGFEVNPDGTIKIGECSGAYSVRLTSDLVSKEKVHTYTISNNKTEGLDIKLSSDKLEVNGDISQNTEVLGLNFKNNQSKSIMVNSSKSELSINNEFDDSSNQNNQNTSNTSKINIYRLYNNRSGEHLYTSDANEKNILSTQTDWDYEGISWKSPATSSEAVYRLYSPVTGFHLYTTDRNEVNILSTQRGWSIDNNGSPLYYSGGDVKIYRLYNEELRQHLLTTDMNEYHTLPAHGWTQEGHKLNGAN